MVTYIVYGVKPWVDDTILGEFKDRDEALDFERKEKIKNEETKYFSYISSKVNL